MTSITRIIKHIARDWRVKILLQNILGLLPGSAGFRINEQLTRFVRGGLAARVNAKKRFLKGINNIRLIQANLGEFTLRDRTILELGTGWHGIDLVIFYLLGAKNILTIDYYPHLTYPNLVSSIRSLLSYPDILDHLSEIGMSSDRKLSLETSLTKSSSLPELLSLLGINYMIMTSAEYRHLLIDQGHIDFFYSESILQRIPVKHLQDLLGVVSSSLSDRAVVFHRTDQSDINAQNHVDKRLWTLNYLRYQEWFFKLFISGKFNSQNRLRESDFLELLDGSGMVPIYLESNYKAADIERLRSFKVARQFQGKTLEDLAIRHSKIICIKTSQRGYANLKRKINRS